MRLHSNAMSPYGRKVMILIHELGLGDRVELVTAQPRERPEEVTSFSPLGKIPVLTTDDGLHLRDSPVIAEYLATEFGDDALLPASGPSRWRLLSEVADADGIIEAAIVVKNERGRPAEQQSVEWIDWHLGKVERSLAQLERQVAALRGRRDLGIIAIGCALGYVPRRLPDYAGLKRFPGLAALYGQLLEWPAFAATEPSP